MGRLRDQMTGQVFGIDPPVDVFPVPYPRHKTHEVFLKAMTPSAQTGSEMHLQAAREFLRRRFAISPFDTFPPDGLIM